MSKPIILLLLLAGLFAGFAGPALAQTEVTQRIPVAVIVNGQQTQGVTVVLNGTVQTFSCANPQPYITTNQSSSGWACYDQNSGTWLLQALPPQSTAGYTPTDSYSYYGNPYPYSYYSYYPNSYYPYSYPYSYYPYFYGPAFAFGFGFGHGYYGYGRNFYGSYGNARVGSVHGTGGFVAHGGGFAHSGGGFAHGGGGFAHAGGFAHGGGGHMGGGHR